MLLRSCAPALLARPQFAGKFSLLLQVAVANPKSTPAREMPWIKPTEIKVPVQYHTGMLDNIRGFSCPRSAVLLCKAMKDAGCEVELFLYEDTPHSFLNALTKEGSNFLVEFGYDTPPQDQVWLCFNRLINFFQHM